MKKGPGKRGMELSLNTIIIAIIAIILLVAVVSFFLFGFKGLTDRIKIIFFGTTAGTDLVLARQICASYCQNAALLPEDIRKDSPYCKSTFFIDMDNDGEADKEEDEYQKFTCYPDNDELGVGCTVKVDETTLDRACLASRPIAPLPII